MGILDGKNLVITGVLTDASLAYGVAEIAKAEGANLILTGAGRALSLTKRTARKIDPEIEVLELDVTVLNTLKPCEIPSANVGAEWTVCYTPSALHRRHVSAMTFSVHLGKTSQPPCIFRPTH